MDLFEAIKGRRSCRNYLPEAITTTVGIDLRQVKRGLRLHSTCRVREIIVITSSHVKERVSLKQKDVCRWAFEKSGCKMA